MTVVEQIMKREGRRWDWLAERVGITKWSMHYLIRQRRTPLPYHHVLAIAFALGVQPEEIVDEKGNWREVGHAVTVSSGRSKAEGE